MQFRTGYEIVLMLATRTGILDTIKVNYGRSSASEAAQELDSELSGEELDGISAEISEAVNSAPVVKLVNSMIDYAIRAGSSDIHIEPMEDRIRVRIRIDGVMQEIMSNPVSAREAITTRIKILGGMNIAEKRIPQDGRIQTEINGTPVDMRVSILPTIWGEKTVIRILAKNDGNLNRKYLGISDHNNELINKIIKVPQGICLISGPTGSGKSTTLQRNMIKMRQKEGIALAKAKGVYSKERSKKLSLSRQAELKKDIQDKVRVCEILKKYGITKPTYYRYKQQWEE